MRSFGIPCLVAVVGLLGCAHNPPSLPIESPYRDLASLEKGQIVHLATGRSVSQQELFDYLARFSVVYVGESHDNIEDHQMQLAVLKGLDERLPGQVALGLEMLRRSYQAKVDAFLRGEIDERAFVREVWSKSWSPRSWPYYRDILRYARDNGIPVHALNVDEELEAALSARQLEDLDPEVRAQLPAFDRDDPYHRSFVEGIFGAHVHGSGRAEIFLQVQTLWDESMAESAAEYLTSDDARKTLLIFAGGIHVRYGFGIPRRLFRRVPLPYVIVDSSAVSTPHATPEVRMEIEIPELPLRTADFYWGVGYSDLEGERVLLGVQVSDAPHGGALVESLLPEGPAARAGLREGDVIVTVGGEAVTDAIDVTYRLDDYALGDKGSLEVLRDGERLPFEVVYDRSRREM